MRALIIGFLVAILLMAGFCLPARTSPASFQRGWPWRVYSAELANRTTIQHWHIHYLLIYALVSVGAGVGAAWLVRHVSTIRHIPSLPNSV